MTIKKPVSRPKIPAKSNCVSCGSIITMHYCANCGEKAFQLHDFELKHYLEESFEGFTHFDNKFFKSTKLLITKPGLLSDDFCKGKRIPYMRPFALFFVCNVLFFLLVGQSNIFSLPLYSFYNFSPFTNFSSKELVDALAPTEEKYSLLAARFNQKMGTDSKTYLAAFIPLFALGGILIQRKKLLTLHLIFSTHYFAFVLLFYTFLTLCITNPFYYLFGKESYNSNYDLISTIGSLLLLGCYYFFAAKRFYQASSKRAIVGTVVTLTLFVLGLYAYRLLLFFKIIANLDS